MPSADQLAGIAAGRTARATYDKAESALLDAVMRLAEARRALEDVTARGSAEEEGLARLQLEALEAKRDKAAAARAQAESDLATSRAQALATGAGFDLLSSRHPLLLLPVRLETRFAWDDGAGGRTFADTGGDRLLLVRIYPDDIHDDAHEPELTPTELVLLKELDRRLDQARDLKDLNDAWADVIRRVGPTRAGWLGEILARGGRPGRRPAVLSRPSVARLLPDSWVAVAELDDSSTRRKESLPVREPLETGPAPDGIDWMIDFDAALKAGMAVVIDGIAAATTEIRRLVVVGVRGTLDPDETATELERLLDAQHYTRGLAFLAPGTPTNSLPGARAGYTSRPAVEDVVPIERRRFEIGLRPRPLCQVGDPSGGSALARALGIRADAFGYVRGADATDAQDEQALRTLLVTATRRHLVRLLPGILEPAALDELLGFGVELLSARGHLPTLRVGAQPYGVLPVLLRGAAPLEEGSAARLLPALDRLRAVWAEAAAGVRWIGASGQDPGETLVRILQQDAVAQRIAFRPLLGPQLGAAVAGAVRGRSPVVRQKAAAARAIEALGAADPLGSPLLEALHLDFAPPLAVPVVEPADAVPTSPQRAKNYLELIASLRPDALLAHDYGGAEQPRSLLFAIARLAVLEGADDAARAALVIAGEDPSLWEEEDVATVFRDPFGTPRRRLEASDPADPVEPLG
ncbi:MAG: hypothetical protein QOE29_2186, partial [Gaiellaceae bacterium]|nr:hypothetical protein [Gaiellaceae bacterium]